MLGSTRLSSLPLNMSEYQTGLNTASETDGCHSNDNACSWTTEVIYRVIVKVHNAVLQMRSSLLNFVSLFS